jgi:hypothetical protein
MRRNPTTLVYIYLGLWTFSGTQIQKSVAFTSFTVGRSHRTLWDPCPRKLWTHEVGCPSDTYRESYGARPILKAKELVLINITSSYSNSNSTCRRASSRSKVDLPFPFGPTSPYRLPCTTLKVVFFINSFPFAITEKPSTCKQGTLFTRLREHKE